MDRIIGLDAEMLKEMSLLLISDIVIILILGYLLYNPVKDFMKKRSDSIKNKIQSAEQALNDANNLKAEYEAKLKNIDNEKSDILDKARKIAKDKEREIIENAKEEAQIIKNRATIEIQREQDKAQDEMKTQIIELSTEMASRYVTEALSNDDQKKLLDNVINSLEESQWQN